jgi:tetratricopeptide (TPR) repeat protein
MEEPGKEVVMQDIQRVLILIVVMELLSCGFLSVRRLGQPQPVLPKVMYDDPLLEADFSALAQAARGGKTREWQLLGEGLLGQGFYAEAELAFRRAVELDSTNATAQFSLAFCIDRTGRIPESTREYLLAAKLARPSPSPIGSREHCLYQVGRNAMREGHPEEAARVFGEISGFFPADYQAAKLLVRSNRSADALPLIENVLKRMPRSLKFNSLKLHALEDLGQMDAATDTARMLERSEYAVPIDFSTNFVEPLNQRVGIQREVVACQELLMNQAIDELAEKLNTLLVVLEPSRDPQKSLFRKSLVEVEFQRKNADRMLELIERLKADGLTDTDLLQMEGAAYALQGDLPRAVPLWERALRRSPNIPLHQMLAGYHGEQGHAPLRDQHWGQAALLTTKLNFLSHPIEAAQQSVKQAQQLIPDDPQVWYYSAEIERALGHLDQAQASYRRCVALNPNHGRALRAMKFFEGTVKEGGSH